MVIYPERGIERLDNYHHYQILLESPLIHRIYLEDLANLSSDSLGVQLIQLIVTQQMQAVVKAQSLVKQAQKLNSKQQIIRLMEMIEAIMVCKLPHLKREEIQKMLDYIELDIKKTQFYQDVIAENKQEWINQGLEKGRLQGQLQGQFELILHLCKHRYGKLSAKITQQIKNLSAKQLDSLALLLLDHPTDFSLDKFKAWLQTQLNS